MGELMPDYDESIIASNRKAFEEELAKGFPGGPIRVERFEPSVEPGTSVLDRIKRLLRRAV